MPKEPHAELDAEVDPEADEQGDEGHRYDVEPPEDQQAERHGGGQADGGGQKDADNRLC